VTPDSATLRLLIAVCAVTLLCTVGMAMPYPILAPIFVDGPADAFTQYAGLPPEWLLGMALAANPAGILLGSLVLGPMSDRLGRRQVLVVTLLACAVGNLVTAGALSARWYPLFLLARFATGLTEGNIAVARALLADHHYEASRVRAFAWLNACQYGGWLLGPLIGGLLLRWGEPVPFAVAALAMLPCAALVLLGVPGSGHDKRRATGDTRALAGSTLAPLVNDPALRRLFGLQLAYMCGVTALYEYAPLWCVTEPVSRPTASPGYRRPMLALVGTALAGRLPSLGHRCAALLAVAAGAAGLCCWSPRARVGHHRPARRAVGDLQRAAASLGLVALRPPRPRPHDGPADDHLLLLQRGHRAGRRRLVALDGPQRHGARRPVCLRCGPGLLALGAA
jgi:MFS family permease